jgi:hypothetical protein
MAPRAAAQPGHDAQHGAAGGMDMQRMMQLHERMMADPVIRERIATDPVLQRMMAEMHGAGGMPMHGGHAGDAGHAGHAGHGGTAGHAGHAGHAAAGAAAAAPPALDPAAQQVMEFVVRLLANPQIEARIHADPRLHALWSDPEVQRALQLMRARQQPDGGSHRH